MSIELQNRIADELHQLSLIDPHTHINPHSPASTTIADILGYHYYTELAHSAGLSREWIEEEGLTPKDKVGRLVEGLAPLKNTVQWEWFLQIARDFFGFTDESLNSTNWERLFDSSAQTMASPDWEQTVLKRSRLNGVFLTNDFDDPLRGFDTEFYIPCLRTDDLVFRLALPSVRQRFQSATSDDPWDVTSLQRGIGNLFNHFIQNNARACAISLPPDFSPAAVSAISIEPLLHRLRVGQVLNATESRLLAQFVFWELACHCDRHQLPFDLMIGVNRRIYPAGVYQGQDLFDSRCSLIQYADLFNAFPRVRFPISVLSHELNHELVSYAWIFPNVVTSGHWWYSNIPTCIERDLRSRLEAVPSNKQIGYYSDMYKLEFALPKFTMFRNSLAKVLANEFVIGRGWSETRAIKLGKTILCDNTELIFPRVLVRS